jgi:ankyrin repeat protein
VVKELLKKNADIEAKDKDGKTALIWGIFHNYLINLKCFLLNKF